MAVAWGLWQERNARVFEDGFSEASEVWCKIKIAASFWASSSRLFDPLSISDISNNWGAVLK